MSTTLKMIIFFMLLLVSFGMSCCGIEGGIKGEGPMISEERSLQEFDAIENKVNADIFLRQGAQEDILIEAQGNILSNLETEVSRGQLEISYIDNNVNHHEGIKIYITIPEIRELGLSGSGLYRSEQMLEGEFLAINISGSGDVNLQASYEQAEIRISGSGDVELRGEGQELGVQVSGSGDVYALEYEVEEADVRISGSGNCELNVAEKLTVSISGSGDVRYKGRPEISSSVIGSGELGPLD